MVTSKANARTQITDKAIAAIRRRLGEDLQVRRTLPEGGRLHVDRQLPFLVVYRPPVAGDDAGTRRLVRGEAAHLIGPASQDHKAKVTKLASAVADVLSDVFGGFLVIELWAGPDEDALPSASGTPAPPGFRVIVPRADVEQRSVRRLARSLGTVRIMGRRAEVEVVSGIPPSPPGMAKIVKSSGTADSPIRLIGLEVRPIYRDGADGEEFPAVGRTLHRQVSRAIQQAAYEFALHQTTHRPRHYQALGRHAFVRAVSQVDEQLAALASSFDLLLSVSPTNTESALGAFRRAKYQKSPRFLYRPQTVDAALTKRRLYKIAIERVEDPTLEYLFREKRRELSLKLDLLTDLGTPRFVHTSMTLYGRVDPVVLATAKDLLEQVPKSRARTGPAVPAAELARRAEVELDKYRQHHPDMRSGVELRDDITSLMVSEGRLLVGKNMSFAPNRVNPLIQHEVGTHVVTYWNGMAQPFRLLATGLAGHDELQEGLAVFAEYLVDGMTPARLRTLAARVVAAASVADGAEFVETFRLLREDHGFEVRSAFLIATRVHRGGGFVKDAVYLRGLQGVVNYVADGGRLDTLLVGKIATDHAPIVEELQRRSALVPPPLRPSYLDEPDTHYRLERVRGGIALIDLLDAR